MPFAPSRRALSGASLLALALLAACSTERLNEPAAAPALTAGPAAAVVAPPGYIRIGVVQEATTVPVGGTGDVQFLNANTGAVLLSGSGEGSVRLVSLPTIESFWRLQVSCSASQTYIADWVIRVAAAGYEPYTEYVASAKCWRLRVGRFPSRQAALDATPRLYSLGLGPKSGTSAFQYTISKDAVFGLTLGMQYMETTAPVRIVAQSGEVTIDSARYRGVAEVRLNGKGSLAGINELPLEDYLLGVVPRELGPIAFPYLEALKAQAVAARTYALANMGKRGNDGYDLTATTSDQVYGGMSAEHPLSSQAVLETAGIVATYNGKLIEALYSSTTGGFTASNEDVYNSAPVPYLRGVPDAQRGEAIEHVPSLEVFQRHANPTSLRNAAEGDFESDWSPKYHRWYVDWSAAEMRSAISNYFGHDVGEVYAVNIPDRSGSGRALKIEFVTETGTYTETKDRIRSALKFYNSGGTLSSLYSTLVFVQPVVDHRTKEVTGWEAWGGGWGHGVGLSQTGAVGMAEKGASYEEILKKYYQGIELETR